MHCDWRDYDCSNYWSNRAKSCNHSVSCNAFFAIHVWDFCNSNHPAKLSVWLLEKVADNGDWHNCYACLCLVQLRSFLFSAAVFLAYSTLSVIILMDRRHGKPFPWRRSISLWVMILYRISGNFKARNIKWSGGIDIAYTIEKRRLQAFSILRVSKCPYRYSCEGAFCGYRKWFYRPRAPAFA